MSMEFRVLGPLEALVDGAQVKLGGPRPRAVLAVLLLHAGQVVPTSRLIDEVWTPDERTRALRRLTNRRERLVRARTRAKNEAHGVLARSLC